MQHEAVQLQKRVTLNTVILCSFFVMFGIGMLSLAWFELYQLHIETQKLKSDLILIKKKHTLERRQMETENGHLQLENQMLKTENTTLWLERNHLEDLIFQLQSELSLAQENCTNLAENYKRATTENKHLLLNLNSCRSDKTEMAYKKIKLHLQLIETPANNSRLTEELAKQRSTTETLVRQNQTVAHKNKLLLFNFSLVLHTDTELSRRNVFLKSNLTSCQSGVQQKENENENLRVKMSETHANNTWLHEEIRAERLKKFTLAEENQLLKINLTSAQNISTHLSALNSMLWSYLKACSAEKQQTVDENRNLKFKLNESFSNNTVLIKVLTENRLLSQTLAVEQHSLEYRNQLLQLDLPLAQNKSAKLYAKKMFYLSNVTSCQSAIQESGRKNRNLKTELNKTQANNILIRQELENETLMRGRFSEEKHHLQANLTLHQNINADLSAENSLLDSKLTVCQSEKQKEEEKNRYLQLQLTKSNANQTLLRESLAQERSICTTLTTDKQLLEDNIQRLRFNLSFAQNQSIRLFAEKASHLTNLKTCETENQRREEENRNLQSKLTEAQANNTWLRNEFANESLASRTLSEENRHLKSNVSLHHRKYGNVSAENIFLLENSTSCQSEKQDKKRQNLDLELELNKTQSNNTLLRRELANERLLSETLNGKKQLLKNTNQLLLLNLSHAQRENANVSAENSILLLNLTSCQSEKQLEDDRNINLQVNLSEVQPNNIWLKTQLANELLMSKTLSEKRELLQANLTLFQNLSANASAENGSLRSSLTSCQVNKTNVEEENRNLRVKLNETMTNNTLLTTELDNDVLTTEILSAEKELLEDEVQLLRSNLSSAESTRTRLLEEKHFLHSNLTLCHTKSIEQKKKSVILRSRLAKTSTWFGDGLTSQKLALEKVYEETEDLKAKISFYQNLNKNLSAERIVLQSNIMSCEDSRKKLEESFVEVEHLRQNLTSCQDDIRQLENEKLHLYMTLNETRANITFLNNVLANERLKRETLNAKIQQLNGSLAISEEKLAVANALQLSIALCQKKHLELLEENQQINAEVDQLQWNVTSANNSVSWLYQEIRNLKEEIVGNVSTLASEKTRNKMVRSILQSPSLEIDGYCDMDALQCSNCRKGWEEHNSRCFQMSVEVLTWLGARANCIDKGGDLAIVKSEKDQMFLTKLVAQLKNSTPGVVLPEAWIGLDDMREENQFTWVGDRKTSLTFWSAGNPDNATEHFDLIDKSEGVKHPHGQDCVVIELNATVENTLTNWNDISCRNERHFICEAKILVVDRTLVPLRV